MISKFQDPLYPGEQHHEKEWILLLPIFSVYDQTAKAAVGLKAHKENIVLGSSRPFSRWSVIQLPLPMPEFVIWLIYCVALKPAGNL